MNKKNVTIITSIIATLVVGGALHAGPGEKKKLVRRVVTARRRPLSAHSDGSNKRSVGSAKTTGSPTKGENKAPKTFTSFAEVEAAFNDFVKQYPNHEATLRGIEQAVKDETVSKAKIVAKLTVAAIKLPTPLTKQVLDSFSNQLDKIIELARS